MLAFPADTGCRDEVVRGGGVDRRGRTDHIPVKGALGLHRTAAASVMPPQAS